MCNRFKDNVGYLGGSASLELAYAMSHQRPIILLHRANITEAVDPFIRDFLLARLRKFAIHNFLDAGRPANLAAIADTGHQVDYDVTANERQAIHDRVNTLLNELKAKYAAT